VGCKKESGQFGGTLPKSGDPSDESGTIIVAGSARRHLVGPTAISVVGEEWAGPNLPTKLGWPPSSRFSAAWVGLLMTQRLAKDAKHEHPRVPKKSDPHGLSARFGITNGFSVGRDRRIPCRHSSSPMMRDTVRAVPLTNTGAARRLTSPRSVNSMQDLSSVRSLLRWAGIRGIRLRRSLVSAAQDVPSSTARRAEGHAGGAAISVSERRMNRGTSSVPGPAGSLAGGVK